MLLGFELEIARIMRSLRIIVRNRWMGLNWLEPSSRVEREKQIP